MIFLRPAITGNLQDAAVTASTTGGSFILRTHADLKNDLARALTRDLKP